MQSLEQYYANELQYLADAGRAFAAKHPQEAALLNPDNVQARDPHVERLFESFAFLTASLRRRLDDDLPELTHALLELLAPQAVRPVPSLTTVQLAPDFNQITAVSRVAPDSELLAAPLQVSATGEQVRCRFRTCYPVELYPLDLTDVRRLAPRDGREGLDLVFTLRGKAGWEKLRLDRLRLHIRGATHQLVYSLYYYLSQRITQVSLFGADGSAPVSAGLESVGFDRGTPVLPYPVRSFPGFRLVQEYFCFPEKFLYLDVVGLDRVPSLSAAGTLTVRIMFDGEAPAWWTLSPDNFLQFCTPAINLYPEHAYPLDYNQRATEYQLYVEKSQPDAYQVFSVDSVIGRPVGDPNAEAVAFRPFYDFRHNREQAEPYFRAIARAGADGELQTFLALAAPDDTALFLPEFSLSIDVRCYNGDYPSRLRPGDVRHRGEVMSAEIGTVRNLSAPTGVCWPPLGGAAQWHFVSHAALNHLGLSDVQTLGNLLRLYDWTGDPANARRVDGLKELAIAEDKCLLFYRGMPAEGLDLTLTLAEENFTEVGDAYLFALVLRHFLALYASTNSFVRLKVRCQKSNEVWEWPALDGTQQTI